MITWSTSYMVGLPRSSHVLNTIVTICVYHVTWETNVNSFNKLTLHIEILVN